MVFSKKWPFFTFVSFSVKKDKKDYFALFGIEKNFFWTRKKKIFSKGLVYGFFQKMAVFHFCFFFPQIKTKRTVSHFSG